MSDDACNAWFALIVHQSRCDTTSAYNVRFFPRASHEVFRELAGGMLRWVSISPLVSNDTFQTLHLLTAIDPYGSPSRLWHVYFLIEEARLFLNSDLFSRSSCTRLANN